MKNIRFFYLKNCHFLVVKFSIYLNRGIFVMHGYVNVLSSHSTDLIRLHRHTGLSCFFVECLIRSYKDYVSAYIIF